MNKLLNHCRLLPYHCRYHCHLKPLIYLYFLYFGNGGNGKIDYDSTELSEKKVKKKPLFLLPSLPFKLLKYIVFCLLQGFIRLLFRGAFFVVSGAWWGNPAPRDRAPITPWVGRFIRRNAYPVHKWRQIMHKCIAGCRFCSNNAIFSMEKCIKE